MTNALYNIKLQILKTHLKAKSIQITHAIKTSNTRKATIFTVLKA